MSVRFPGESKAYRAARNRLLKAEIALRKKTEEVAALRRKLPLGGAVKPDYLFEEGVGDPITVHEVRLSELFGDKKTLVLYGFMYGPSAKAPCPMCTSFLDALDRQAQSIEQSVALAVSAKSPIARIRAFARDRGWGHMRLVSSSRTTFQRDYHAEDDGGNQWPMMNVFVKRRGKVQHFWGSEMLYAKGPVSIPRTDTRHIDALWPLWNVLDLTPEGRGKSWYPKNEY